MSVGEWRPIETWTPVDCHVLVTDGVEVWKAERGHNGWPREDEWCEEPTHWMPTPKPPKDNSE